MKVAKDLGLIAKQRGGLQFAAEGRKEIIKTPCQFDMFWKNNEWLTDQVILLLNVIWNIFLKFIGMHQLRDAGYQLHKTVSDRCLPIFI